MRYAGEKLGDTPGFFASLVKTMMELLGGTFPEVTRDPDSVTDIINEEEKHFLKTRGQKLFDSTFTSKDTGKVGQPKEIFSSTAASGILTNDLVNIMETVKETGILAEPIKDDIFQPGAVGGEKEKTSLALRTEPAPSIVPSSDRNMETKARNDAASVQKDVDMTAPAVRIYAWSVDRSCLDYMLTAVPVILGRKVGRIEGKTKITAVF